MHHYWEVKMLSPLYGTAMIVGLVTKATNITTGGARGTGLGECKESQILQNRLS